MKRIGVYSSILGTLSSTVLFSNYIDYTVKSGDTLFGIAFSYDMTANEFLKVNNIKDPDSYKLKVGEKLKVKDKEYKLFFDSKTKTFSLNEASQKSYKNYTVKNGDTLLDIAYKHGMSATEFSDINNIKDFKTYNLKVGEVLKVANVDEKSNNTSNTSTVKPNTAKPNSNDDFERVPYKVKSGDTLSEIAEDFGMDLVDLYSINNITDKYVLKVGDVLKVYDEDEIKTIVVESNYKVKSGDTLYSIARNHSMSINELLEVNKIKDINSYKLLVGNTIKVTTIKKQSKRETRSLPDASFSWPYRGSIVSKYGVDSEKLSNRGIRISAKVGDNVLAADEGIVEYADNIRGFGFVVILKHRNGYNTSYANLSKLNVKLGDIVKKGESLGAIGSSPLTKKDELYFKVSYLGYPVDPVKLLPEG